MKSKTAKCFKKKQLENCLPSSKKSKKGIKKSTSEDSKTIIQKETMKN
jgi:hypothetical protein